MPRPWRDEQRLEELGYTERCHYCGRIGDTTCCGCDDHDDEEADEETDE